MTGMQQGLNIMIGRQSNVINKTSCARVLSRSMYSNIMQLVPHPILVYKLCPFLGCYYVALLIVQELCESRGGRPGLSVLTSLLVSVDVKIY